MVRVCLFLKQWDCSRARLLKRNQAYPQMLGRCKIYPQEGLCTLCSYGWRGGWPPATQDSHKLILYNMFIINTTWHQTSCFNSVFLTMPWSFSHKVHAVCMVCSLPRQKCTTRKCDHLELTWIKQICQTANYKFCWKSESASRSGEKYSPSVISCVNNVESCTCLRCTADFGSSFDRKLEIWREMWLWFLLKHAYSRRQLVPSHFCLSSHLLFTKGNNFLSWPTHMQHLPPPCPSLLISCFAPILIIMMSITNWSGNKDANEVWMRA